MRTLKLTIAYDGTAYAGWQIQPDKLSVQEILQKAVASVTGHEVSILASGRTDAGVHAAGQVVGFRTHSRLPPDVLVRAINANLPKDVVVLDAADAPDDFHPIRDVVRKRYRYTIDDGPLRDVFHRHFVWHYVYGRLDVDAMRRAAVSLLGTHDFSSFETSGAKRKTSIRTIFELSIERGRAGGPQNLIAIDVEADGFLYNMVRTIVGTLVEVGRGSQPESWPADVLTAQDRRCAGPTAPPEGLCLLKAVYRS